MSSHARIPFLIVLAALALMAGPAPADAPWRGYIFSWPTSGSGLVIGWTQAGFATRQECVKWVVDQRAAGAKIYNVTHATAGGCSQ